ncbi:hypothetical protein G3580_03690 [Nitrogeniibacter mangrovi]|uniref:Uncharacterized protein n=1 Tax=Nitrogeniibacter mangrovi TaxID=2016596 RepID=A0A6C1AZS2_9RHOO|nr:hypothetical protein [Nitrogeniibacter mangrovi]QID16817.1 hypothetical protein G3580_03690 [Nitrogeniibacter mangrovi]
MQKTETTTPHPIIEHMERTQALACAEWDAAQRILDIQSAALRRLMALPNGKGAHRAPAAPGGMADLAAPWAGLYQQAIDTAMEASAISMDTLAQIQNEMVNCSHEILPLFQRGVADGVERLSRAMASLPAVTAPARHDKSA